MNINTNDLIELLINNPQNDFQSGYNSAIIELLKKSIGNSEPTTLTEFIQTNFRKVLPTITIKFMDEMGSFLINKSKINATKLLKHETNMGLKEAKEYCDDVFLKYTNWEHNQKW